MWVLVAMWVGCTALNLTKAYHIDDTAHLEIARGIQADPLHPMSAKVNWAQTTEPVHTLNQPHLFYYLMAGWMSVCGESEIALHLLLSVFTGLVIGSGYWLARMLVPHLAVWVTALLVLGPAFLPGQNVMSDVPLLACWLLFFTCLVACRTECRLRVYAGAAAALSAACLIKYTSLAVVPILPIMIVQRRHWRALWVLLIVVATLVAWSLFNLSDYGGIHLLGRAVGGGGLGVVMSMVVDWVAGLGAISAFSLMFLLRKRWARVDVGLVLAAGVAGACLFATSRGADASLLTAMLWGLFYANGFFVIGLAVLAFVRGVGAAEGAGVTETRDVNVLLGLWLAAGVGFMVLFAPFMAVRHILLVLPAVLLLLAYNRSDLFGGVSVKLGCVASVILGCVLTVSDALYADAQRAYAKALRESYPEQQLIASGHWGWQWYIKQNGIEHYDPERTVLRPGGLMVVPQNVHGPEIPGRAWRQLESVGEDVVPAMPLTWVRTVARGGGGYYAFSFQQQTLPWTVTRAPLERFRLYRVTRASSSRRGRGKPTR